MGVDTFLNPHGSGVASEIELARSTDDEKQSQLKRLADFQQRNAGEAEACLAKLRQAVIDNGNVFAVMMDAVRHCSLGQISNALYLVGGQYRRSMQELCLRLSRRRYPLRTALAVRRLASRRCRPRQP
ncbi:MAG: methylmalonyl-CoA mutase family protein [Sulfuritalea sp.]|nr:methylmalonyl-CoA mutase family protein [Sulfuritalea sp.]